MKNSGSSEPRDTRERIMATAELLFAADGFDASSLRRITLEAGVNLAAVNYHFGSKDELLREILERRIVPLNERRLAMLQDFREKSAGLPLTIEKIFEAFLVPLFQKAPPAFGTDPVFIKMLGRVISERPELFRKEVKEHFHPIQKIFLQVLRETLPEMPEKDLLWRFQFAVTLMIASVNQRDRIMSASDGICDPDDTEDMVSRLIQFICAGFHEPNFMPDEIPAEMATNPKENIVI